MSKVSKVAIIAIMGVALLGAIPAEASVNYNTDNTRYHRSYDEDHYRSLSRRYDRFGDRLTIRSYSPMIKIMTDDDFFRNDFRLRNRYRDNLPSVLGARNFVIEDRSNDRRNITIRNYNTGPFSVNRATVRVNSDIFDRISRNIDIDQEIDVVVNTGDNTISFNTRTGSISSGDVDINIR